MNIHFHPPIPFLLITKKKKKRSITNVVRCHTNTKAKHRSIPECVKNIFNMHKFDIIGVTFLTHGKNKSQKLNNKTYKTNNVLQNKASILILILLLKLQNLHKLYKLLNLQKLHRYPAEFIAKNKTYHGNHKMDGTNHK